MVNRMKNRSHHSKRKALGYIVLVGEEGPRKESEEYCGRKAELKRLSRSLGLTLSRCAVDEVPVNGTRSTGKAGLREILRTAGPEFPVVLLYRLDFSTVEIALLVIHFHRQSVQVIEVESRKNLSLELKHLREVVRTSDIEEAHRAKRALSQLKRRATRETTGNTPGKKPFGTLVGEAETVRRILQLRRKPKYGKRLSYQKIADALNRDPKYRTRQGAQWQSRTVQAIVRRTRPSLDK